VNTIALETHLRPIQHILDNKEVSEISVNKPGEVWFHDGNNLAFEKVEALTFDHLQRTAALVASFSKQTIGDENPLLSATLPDGNRVQFVLPPNCRTGCIVMSIRKQVVNNMTLDDYQDQGLFDDVTFGDRTKSVSNDETREIYKNGSVRDFMKSAVLERKNILISGGTNSGKTTLLRACVNSIPNSERILTIEDVEELFPTQPNHVPLLFSRNEQGVSSVTAKDLLVASLRLRPDRIIYGEIREGEAYDFLNALNTGHSGSMSTVHANSVDLAFQRIALMVLQAGIRLNRDEIIEYIKSVIDVVIQLKYNPLLNSRTIEEIRYL